MCFPTRIPASSRRARSSRTILGVTPRNSPAPAQPSRGGSSASPRSSVISASECLNATSTSGPHLANSRPLPTCGSTADFREISTPKGRPRGGNTNPRLSFSKVGLHPPWRSGTTIYTVIAVTYRQAISWTQAGPVPSSSCVGDQRLPIDDWDRVYRARFVREGTGFGRRRLAATGKKYQFKLLVEKKPR